MSSVRASLCMQSTVRTGPCLHIQKHHCKHKKGTASAYMLRSVSMRPLPSAFCLHRTAAFVKCAASSCRPPSCHIDTHGQLGHQGPHGQPGTDSPTLTLAVSALAATCIRGALGRILGDNGSGAHCHEAASRVFLGTSTKRLPVLCDYGCACHYSSVQAQADVHADAGYPQYAWPCC